MRKKFLAALTVMALALSTIGGTAFAAEPAATELKSGVYAVDISWQPMMDRMMDPMVEIDAEEMTFDVYNAAAPETSKGSGTIAYDAESSEYTMTFTAGGPAGKETTFTYANEKITFISALYYGGASFAKIDPYTAVNKSAGAGSELVSGEYVVDISWQPMMDKMMDPIVKVNAEEMTFDVYNKTAPEKSKGSGTIAYDAESAEYTMTYTAGVKEANIGTTTTFTYKDGEMTLLSALLYGGASFNRVGTYDATYASALPETGDTTGEGEGAGNEGAGTGTENNGTAGDNTDNSGKTDGKSPQTGDAASSTWMILVCAAAVAVVGVVARKRAVV